MNNNNLYKGYKTGSHCSKEEEIERLIRKQSETFYKMRPTNWKLILFYKPRFKSRYLKFSPTTLVDICN